MAWIRANLNLTHILAKMKFTEYLQEKENCSIISGTQLKDLEKFADRLLDKFGIDIEFTKHFGERMSDSRNDPCIKISELQSLFKKIAKDGGKKVKAQKNNEAVLKDLQTDLNLPVVVDVKGDGEFEVRVKTIMRKKNFKTPSPEVKYESEQQKNMDSILKLSKKSMANKKKKLMTTLPEDFAGALKSAISPVLSRNNYKLAKDALDKVIERKRHAGQLNHDRLYYAYSVAKTFRNVDPRKLAEM